jgi:hypothetical protein
MTEAEPEPEPMQPKMGWLDSQSVTVQFGLLACGVFFFFGVHNLLQEAMMNIPGFEFGVMLGYLEVLGYDIICYRMIVFLLLYLSKRLRVLIPSCCLLFLSLFSVDAE